MIIDDDYSQYEAFRIVNKADADAIARFNKDIETCGGEEEALLRLRKWREEAAERKARADSTEKSLYDITFAERMALCWENFTRENFRKENPDT